jgi:hypothetical protein
VRERRLNLLGEIAASRPMLASSVIAAGLAAIAAAAYRNAPASFAPVSYSFIAAFAVMTLAPAAIASLAPRNFWLRLFYGGVAAGLILAVRRLVLQGGVDIASLRLDIVLAVAAFAVGALSLGAPLWRGHLRLAILGLCAATLGLTGGLSVVAFEAARMGAVPAAGAALGFAAAVSAAFAVFLASGFSGAFAAGAGVADAAGRAAQAIMAPALLALALTTVSLAAGAFLIGGSAQSAAIVAAGALAAVFAPMLVMGAGALSLKTATEALAVEENRRRAGLHPFLKRVRSIAPPSSAIAAVAIMLIATVVAGFDSQASASLAEIVVILSAFAVALVVFVSVRTSLLLVVLLIIASRLSVWGAERLMGAAPPENIRIVALALAAVLYSPLVLAWRDNRGVRRKAFDVMQRAVGDSYFSYVAASVLALAALASAEAGGLWTSGAEAALFAGAMALIGAAVAPPLMTAMGAVFGRD